MLDIPQRGKTPLPGLLMALLIGSLMWAAGIWLVLR